MLGFLKLDLATDACPLDRWGPRRTNRRPVGSRWLGAFPVARLRGAERRWEQSRTIHHLRLRGLAAVTFAWFFLRCCCSEQRVHSGLYDGLTWPDTGCASLD
jgi:hypothetical protein